MPTNISTAGIVGSDNIVPVYNPNGLWKMWSIHELWNGTIGTSRFVPNIDDYAIDPATYTTYHVTAIDPVTLIPTLVEIRPANMSFSFSGLDVLLGVGPGTPSDTYRVYIDQGVLPYKLSVDARLRVNGTMCSYCKIFKGADLTASGHVISRIYDNSGNFITNNIPLEVVSMDNVTNYAVKVPAQAACIEALLDNEILTAVFYTADGHVVSKRQLLVENSSFIRSLNASQRYVTHINLECPFISTTLARTIEFPLNIPITALNLIGVVNYSNGESVRMPVDGTKFKVFGLEQYVSTIVGQTIPLVLAYNLSVGEAAYAGVSASGNMITEGYTMKTTNPNNAYTVKLFGYPVWISDVIGYSVKWYMLNLDRNIFFDVTGMVSFATSTGAFDPKAYGILQRKQVSINLRDISGSFKPYIHSQVVDITLNSPPSGRSTPWLVATDYVPGRLNYGANAVAILSAGTTNVINISASNLNYVDWLNSVYYNTWPLINPSIETSPPEPTHFQIMQGVSLVEFPITNWNLPLNVTFSPAINSTIGIKFIRRTGSGDLQLSIGSMLVVQ